MSKKLGRAKEVWGSIKRIKEVYLTEVTISEILNTPH